MLPSLHKASDVCELPECFYKGLKGVILNTFCTATSFTECVL